MIQRFLKNRKISDLAFAQSESHPNTRKSNAPLWLLLLCFFFSNQVEAHKWVTEGRAIVALDNLGLFSDSTFAGNTVSFHKEGEIFRFLDMTKQLHEDDAQKQLFPWYKVETLSGKTGWLYGDVVMVMLPRMKVSETLSDFFRKRFDFEAGFSDAILWVGAVTGREIISSDKRYHPIYREEYLILTDSSGVSRSVSINSNKLYGSTHLKKVEIADVTGDDVPEIILQKISYAKRNYTNTLLTQIFAFAENGEPINIFEESLNVPDTESGSPMKFKFLDIRPKTIRIEHVGGIECKGEFRVKGQPETCLRHFTESYFWNEKKFLFESLREPFRAPVKGISKKDKIALRRKPSGRASSVTQLYRNNLVYIVREVSTTIQVNGKPRQEFWLYVREAGGKYGYLRAKDVEFINITNAPVFNEIYDSGKGIVDERRYIQLNTP